MYVAEMWRSEIPEEEEKGNGVLERKASEVGELWSATETLTFMAI